jgi:hypothetical protein
MVADPPNLEPDLRAASDAFIAQLQLLGSMEQQKRETPVGHPAFPRYAAEVLDAAKALVARASEQLAAAVRVHADPGAGAAETIESIPPTMSAAEILRRWRETERRISELEPDMQETRILRAQAVAYRDAYQRIHRDGPPDR